MVTGPDKVTGAVATKICMAQQMTTGGANQITIIRHTDTGTTAAAVRPDRALTGCGWLGRWLVAKSNNTKRLAFLIPGDDVLYYCF